MLTANQEHRHSHAQNRYAVQPTPLRLGVGERLTGQGITIAFLDSGFYPHPDLKQPSNRILAYHDVTDPRARLDTNRQPESWDWHGTMTSVAAAGSGFLSDGLYRGLASDARVVLVKVSEQGRITDYNIERGLSWVIENRERLNIRVLSISLGGDEDVSYKHSAVDMAAEDAVRAGIVVVVAAGNSGCTDLHYALPPANSPSVITVGGYDDNNVIGGDLDLYCSNYGVTVDGIVKPDLLAPAMWVAAPILPGTEAYTRAEALSRLSALPDYLMRDSASDLWERAGLPLQLRSAGVEAVREEVHRLIKEKKIVSTHYQHVDGTSFAAPVVASLIALMIEINPKLTPAAVKHILVSTASRIAGRDALRQGFGVLNARQALESARRERHFQEQHYACPPRVVGKTLEFSFHNDSAESVSLAGDFDDWTAHGFAKDTSGVWRAKITIPPAGRYRYKFMIDGARWIEDPANLMKEPDGYGGLNSVIELS